MAINAAEPHSYNPTTHRCTVCGIPDSNYCNHTDTKYVSAGSEGHIQYCTNCSARLSDIEPHHRVGDVCDLCGYDKFNCTHEHTTWGYNDEYHHLTCDDCDDIIDSGEHVGMGDGICDKCGYNVNTTHHFPPNSHNCSDPGCGYRSFCSDEDGDCKCDICGTEVHDWAICKDLDDNSHEWFCSKCKKSLGKAPHVDIDDGGDGKCDGCGHKMSGTTGGGTTGGKENTGLDKVPKTGDVMAPVAILSGLMSVAAVFTRKRFF